MKFAYGNFRSRPEDNFAFVGGGITGNTGSGGRLESVTRKLDVEFVLVPPSGYAGNVQSYLTSRMRAIQSAVKEWGRDVGFVQDNGAPSAIWINSSETATGVQILEFPGPIPDQPGVDYATSLKGRCSFSADYLPSQFGVIVPGGNQNILEYGERVEFQGNGGPRVVWQEFSSGPPLAYTTADRTLCRATQQGSIVVEAAGPRSYGDANAPIWPDLLVNEGQAISEEDVELGEGRWRCIRSWNYQFIGGRPFNR